MPDLATLIAEFQAAAGGGDRAARGALAHVVASDLGARDVASVRGTDVEALLAHLRAEGLSSAREAAVLDGLRQVFAYAVERDLLRVSPLVGLAAAPAARSPAAPSPTTAMVWLGRRTVAWAARTMIVAFVLMAVGLAVAVLA